MIRLSLKTKILLIIFVVLLSSVILAVYFSSKNVTHKAFSSRISANVTRELLKVRDDDYARIVKSLSDPSEIYEQTAYPFFVYERDSLKFWSDNKFVPPSGAISEPFDIKLLKASGGIYLLSKKAVDSRISIISLVLLQRDYIISNDYLSREWNRNIFSSGEIRIDDPDNESGVPVYFSDVCLFKINAVAGEYPANRTFVIVAWVLVFFTVVAFVLLVFHLNTFISKRSADVGFVFLFIAFWLMREVMTVFGVPNVFTKTELFDPQIFAVSSLNASLGDLLLNMLVILILCRYIFKNYFRSALMTTALKSPARLAINAICCLFIFMAGLFPFVVIQTLYNNSSITLDISQSLQFNSLRIIAYLIIMLAGISAFLFSHGFIRILAADRSKLRIFGGVVIGIGLFIFFNSLTKQNYFSSLIVTLGYFAIIFFQRLYRSLKRLSYATFSYLFLAIFFLSLNGAYAIQLFSHKEKLQNQFRFAERFLVDRDIFGEYLLHEAYLKIANDAFTQTRILTPFLRKEAIGQKIRQYFLPSYFNKYDVEIFIYNSVGQSVGNELAPSFLDLIGKYDKSASPTEYEGLRFVNNPESDVTQKYLMVVPIQRIENISGYVVLELSLKKIIPESVYPELLVDHSQQQINREQDLSYAVFSNGKLLYSSGDFNYEKYFGASRLGNTKLYTEGLSLNSYDHIAIEDDNNRIAIVSTPALESLYQFTNFSFLFVMGLLIILILIFIQGIINYFSGSRLFFSARIQLYLNLAFFVPLIIVSVSTLGLTSRSSQQQLDEEYLSKARTFGQQITSEIADSFYQSGQKVASLNNRLAELSTVSKLEANVYDPRGTLAGTTQPQIFENHLLSPLINSRALLKINSGENNFIEAERVGKLKYFVAYSSLRSSQTGKILGILGIPFFQSSYSLEKIQIVLLANILNIFAMIFIALLVLSYFVSEWLTFPLRFITQSLKRTSLTRINKPLTWNASDEIGLMVKEYNSMLYKLSESKSQLEVTQREKAWREIAQQVAHEIKNPLTPMKLTLQQLERSIQNGNGSTEKTKKAIEALLAQVNTLNDIASSFSGFAKMPELNIIPVDLVSLIRRCVDLHSSSGEVIFRTNLKRAFVEADEHLLERTFSNLIINGLQSGSATQRIRIDVKLERLDDFYRAEITDNGRGISPEIAELVFLPHFSTKKSGSGLGLAIAKQGIEQLKGRIWFETKIGTGTTFFVELPSNDRD